MELAPEIRVNAVAPGLVLPRASGRNPGAGRTLLKRWGTPDDVAGAVRYLLEADYVTGTVVTVDGGERLVVR